MKVEPETVGDLIALRARHEHGSQAAAAKAWGLRVNKLSRIVRGWERPPEDLLARLNLVRHEVYVPAGLPVVGLPLRKAAP